MPLHTEEEEVRPDFGLKKRISAAVPTQKRKRTKSPTPNKRQKTNAKSPSAGSTPQKNVRFTAQQRAILVKSWKIGFILESSNHEHLARLAGLQVKQVRAPVSLPRFL